MHDTYPPQYGMTVLMIAATGAATMALIVLTQNGIGLTQPLLPLVCIAFYGALTAAWPTAWFFGHPGSFGWALAGLGALLSTAVGGAIGGTTIFLMEVGLSEATWLTGHAIVVPLASACLVLVSLFQSEVGLPWLVLMTAVHLVALRGRG